MIFDTSLIIFSLFIFILSFLFGSFSFGIFVSKRGLSIWPWGLLGLVLDILKGACIPLVIPSLINREFLPFFNEKPFEWDDSGNLLMLWSVGFFSVLGDCYSPWIKYRDGKGVPTGFGALIVLAPVAAFLGLMGFLLTFFYKRIVSLSSIVGLVLASVGYLVLNPIGVHVWMGAFSVFIMLSRHEENMDILLEA